MTNHEKKGEQKSRLGFFVSPEGKIVTHNMRGSWLDKKLTELYDNTLTLYFDDAFALS